MPGVGEGAGGGWRFGDVGRGAVVTVEEGPWADGTVVPATA